MGRTRYVRGALAVLLTVVGCHRGGGRAIPAPPGGPSVIRHLGLDLDHTAMGKQGGGRPAPRLGAREPMPNRGTEPFVLEGADLYRLSCQSCHGPDGKGAPPEIPSVLPLATAMVPAHGAGGQSSGSSVDEATVRQIARTARQLVIARVEGGGQKMPAFAYLHAEERNTLVDYLPRLAGAAAPSSPARLTMPAARAGELLVRGTCHICHDATGPGSHHQVMMAGVIPSLEALRDRPLGFVVRKVQRGQWGGMGGMGPGMGPGMHGRWRMPAYPYLTVAEIAAAYLYIQNPSASP